MKIKPRCKKQNDGYDKEIRGIAYASNGYLLPCCWLDVVHIKPELEAHGFYDEGLKLENNDTVEEILTSDVWVEYFRKLEEEPDKCLSRCHLYCGVRDES